MSDTLEKLAAELTDEQLERAGNSAADFLKAAQEDPELMREAMEKVGGPFLQSLGESLRGFGRNIAPAAGKLGAGALLGAGVTAGAAGVDLAAGKIRDKHNSMQKAKRYSEMMGAHPELATRGVDSKMVQRHFDTLHKFNPEYADDPMVAGTYVKNQMESERPDINSLNNIVKARGDITKAQNPQTTGKMMVSGLAGRFTDVDPKKDVNLNQQGNLF